MEEREISDIVLFLGRFHPMILHLPIGFLFLAFALGILSRFAKFRKYKPALGLALALGAASAVVAAILGYMLAQAGGYDEDLLSLHQWSGIAVAVFSVVAYLLYRQYENKPSVVGHRVYLSVLSMMVIVLLVAGHYGGSLTHGSDYLTQYMPNNLRSLAGLRIKEQKAFKQITDLPEAVVFTDIIYPVLETRCNSCHNESKSKGGLQMHTVEDLMRGGENGPVLMAGNAQSSEIIRRVHLPDNDEDHMPPKGKRQLSDAQIDLLSWWINEGAPFDKKVAQVNVEEKIQDILNELIDPDANKTEVEILLASKVKSHDPQILGHLQRQGVQVKPLASQINWLQASISQNLLGDSSISSLLNVSEQLTWLDLRGTSITDQALASIGKFRNLTRLHLENTQITDEGLQHLKNLRYLQYLNLYGTQVSDEGLPQLYDLKNLKTLYIWQTQVTKEGVSELKKVLPGLQIHLGMDNKMDVFKMTARGPVEN